MILTENTTYKEGEQMVKVFFQRSATSFPESIVLFPTGFCPLVMAKEYARTNNVILLAVETVGTDGRPRRYNMKVLS